MASPRPETNDRAKTEIELKLATSPSNLNKLLKSINKAGGFNAKSRKTARVISKYYDTEDRRLHRKNLTLRVREIDGRRTQTVKSEGISVSGMLSREEWTAPLLRNVPDLTLMKSSDLNERMGLILSQELTPLFITDVKRTIILVNHIRDPSSSAQIELTFDRGKVVVGKKHQNISEVELELISGSTSALIDMARILADAVPMMLNLTSKVNRGFEIRDGIEPKALTAFTTRLDGRASVEEGMGLIFTSALNHLLVNRAAAVRGKDIEGLHQVRVAIRRITSAFTLFQDIIPKKDTKYFKAEIVWMMSALGPARDLDVFLNDIVSVVQKDRKNDPDLLVLIKNTKKARTTAYRKVRSVLSSARYTRAVLALAAWVHEGGWRRHKPNMGLNERLQNIAEKLLTHRHRKVLKLGRYFKDLCPDERHDVRIALKKLRYATEFFSGLYPEKSSRHYMTSIRKLQDLLGAANDVAVSEELTQMLVRSGRRGTKEAAALQRGAGKVMGWHTKATADTEVDILDRWATFMKSKPFWSSA